GRQGPRRTPRRREDYAIARSSLPPVWFSFFLPGFLYGPYDHLRPTSPLAPHEFQTELLLGPQHHGRAVEEGDDGGRRCGRIGRAKRGEGDHHIAFVIEGDREQPIARLVVGNLVGPAEAVHPADLDRAAGAEGAHHPADEVRVGDALQFSVV